MDFPEMKRAESVSRFQPIETYRAGCRFRSRLEARWSVFHDVLEVPWRYEHEPYRMPDGTGYLPDFWLPSIDAWFEVKGDRYTDDEARKAWGLAEATGKDVYIAFGDCRPDQDAWAGIHLFGPGRVWNHLQFWTDGLDGELSIAFCGWVRIGRELPTIRSKTPRLLKAYRAARSARFGT
jgi:hypothetical protein